MYGLAGLGQRADGSPGVDFEVTETPAIFRAGSRGDNRVKISDYEAGGAESLGPPFLAPVRSAAPRVPWGPTGQAQLSPTGERPLHV